MSDDPLRNYPYEVQERAAVYQFEAGMTREEAEAKAIEDYRKENAPREGRRSRTLDGVVGNSGGAA